MCFSVNKSTYLSLVSHWILPAMRHQSLNFTEVLRPSVISTKRLWVQIPMWIWPGLELRCVVSSPNLHCTISLPWYKFYSWRININIVLLNSSYFTEGSTFVLYWFMDLSNVHCQCICHYSIIQNTITALKTPVFHLLTLRSHPNFWNHWILYCPYSFASESQMSYLESKVFSLFSLASFT